jgi:hypothetical protein
MYHAGLSGYDTWVHELENGTADGHGIAYNAAVWSECRSYGAPFLKEAEKRLNGKVSPLFEGAAQRYSAVYKNLEKVSNMFPFPLGNEIADKERCDKAVNYLKNARKEEKVGLGLLNEVVMAL